MFLRLGEVPAEGLDVELSLEPDAPAARSINADGPVKGTFRIEKTGSQVLITGSVSGFVRLECSRCLTSYRHKIEEKIFVELRPLSDTGEGEEMELASDDLNVEFFQGDSLDLDHFIEEQVRLALPMKPLCSQECGGLCPSCGEASGCDVCTCNVEDIDPRWKALESLRDPGKDKGES